MSWVAVRWVEAHDFDTPAERLVALTFAIAAADDGNVKESIRFVSRRTRVKWASVCAIKEALLKRGILIMVTKADAPYRADTLRIPIEQPAPERKLTRRRRLAAARLAEAEAGEGGR